MDCAEFKETVAHLMERKRHWAWPDFATGRVADDRLHIHFEQEFATYVCDLAVLLGRAYVQCTVRSVRVELAAWLYEAETGELSLGEPHAEHFLRYMRSLGIDHRRFDRITMLHEAARFRAYIDEATLECGWETAMVVATIFLKGEEDWVGRGLASRPGPHPVGDIEPRDTRSRVAAWRLLEAVEPAAYPQVLASLEELLTRWTVYRDAVARACGRARSSA